MIRQPLDESNKSIRRLFLQMAIFMILINSGICVSQDSLNRKELIAVLGKPSNDSITLRWAPLNFEVWKIGNEYGYAIKRYTIIRDSAIVNPPETKILNLFPVKPKPLPEWEPIIDKDKYVAIAAQAIYGEQFEVNLTENNIVTIVNKVREQEQRYYFSLFSADMSPEAAKASGLWYVDSAIKANEKYLYRIQIAGESDSIKGSVFIGAKDWYSLPQPQNLKADFKSPMVSIQWEKDLFGYYTAYRLEKSLDGVAFEYLSDSPLTTISSEQSIQQSFEYASDTITHFGFEYYYRVRGISPFGELGPPSAVVKVKSQKSLTNVPFLKNGVMLNSGLVRVEWELDEEKNEAIKGFSVERADKSKGEYKSVNEKLLPSSYRNFDYLETHQINYYRIKTVSHNGDEYVSAPYLVQLIDSIPPSIPINLKVQVDDYGNVQINWEKNAEIDLIGYRVYRSNFSDEELIMLTGSPIVSNTFLDKVNVNSLQESVFYSVSAVDRNQNESSVSHRVKLILPDKIKPQAPVLLPIKSSDEGVLISWLASGSADVVRYDVYRQVTKEDSWVRIKMVDAKTDSIYSFLDNNTEGGKVCVYTIIAIDDASLESEPTVPVKGLKIDNVLQPGIEWKDFVIDKEMKTVTLHWSCEIDDVQQFRIYRAVNDEELRLYRSIDGERNHFEDRIISSKQYQYTVMPILKNGTKSRMSSLISIKF